MDFVICRKTIQNAFDSGFKPIGSNGNLCILSKGSLVKQYVNPGKGEWAICVGTPLYGGLAFSEILNAAAHDFFSGTLDPDAIKGNYLFVFSGKKGIQILPDKAGQHALFFDKENQVLSNSLLTLLTSSPKPHKLHKMGLYEKIALGYTLGEDTLFEGIVKITYRNKGLLDVLGIDYIERCKSDLNSFGFHKERKAESIKRQIDRLAAYFDLIDRTFAGKKGDLGLSGGFDSRLLLALAEKGLSTKLHVHTHATKDVHESQKQYAEELAELYGAPLDSVDTLPPLALSDADLEAMLSDNLCFFDGRSARHLGAFSQTYTPWYKQKTMGDAFYSLNGIGGEIYRDSYFIGKKKMAWEDWAKRHLFLPLTEEILPPKIKSDLLERLKVKLAHELPWHKGRYDLFYTQAFYGLVKMPQCNGNLTAAYNRISPFLLPFVEPDNVEEALSAVPYLGVGGFYQAEMIARLSPEMAKLPTDYGSSFHNLGWRYYLESELKTMGSLKLRRKLVTKKMRMKSETQKHRIFLDKLHHREIIRKDLENLSGLVPGLKPDLAMVEPAQRRNLIFLGHFLTKYQNFYERT